MSRKKSNEHIETSSRPHGKRLLVFFGGVTVLLACAAIRFAGGDRHVQASPQATPAPAANIVAEVNGHKITRRQLGEKCLQQFGEEVLEAVVNRQLIEQQCRKQNIIISPSAVDKEIEQIARRFGLPVDQWMTLLATERSMTQDQYRDEVVWPMLALRRLAANQLKVSEAEIQKEIDGRFGPQVKARIIVLRSRQKAEQVRRMAVATPDDFPKLAKEHSTDENSASVYGQIQPIRRHMGDPHIEKTAFALKDGQVSEVLAVGDQFVLLKCEGQIAGSQPKDSQLKQIRTAIVENIRHRKLRDAGAKLFRDLQQQAQLENIWNDEVKRKQMPGVAATLNGQAITIRELEEACIKRHGKAVLESIINQAVLEMALAKSELRITQDDIHREISRAAIDAGFVDTKGNPDLPTWFKTISKENEMSRSAYEREIVWPTVALKKLVGKVEISKEELQKGFEANYGPRVRCRAIVLDSLRRAQEVWKAARNKPTPEFFAELAAQYSVDPASRSTGGVVPPIQKHGGQPALEAEAFRLQPGELSGVVQVAGKYVVLLCEGITKPEVVDLADVRDLLLQDLLERKYRVAMAKHFEELIAASHITNHLDPSASHKPAATTAQRSASGQSVVTSR